MTDFKNKYQVQLSTKEQIINNFLALKCNPYYKANAINAMQNIIELFCYIYPDVSIEDPIFREKSIKSGLFKLKELKIERFAKLFTFHKTTQSDMENFYNMIKDRVLETIPQSEQKNILQKIQTLLYDNLQNIDLHDLENILMNCNLSVDNRRALIRILYQRIKDSNLPDISDQLKYIEDNYGYVSSVKQNKPENDILRYCNIQKLHDNPSLIKNIMDEKNFVQCHDLRGGTLVITNIPSNIKTNNIELKKLLNIRDSYDKNSIEYKTLDHQCMVILSEEFMNYLCNSSMYNKKIVPDTLKHKNKSNGYEAYHVELTVDDEPNHFLELQLKSKYVDKISKGNGSASHCKRFSKQRVIPNMSSIAEFKKSLNHMLPHYIEFQKDNGYKPYEYSLKEDVFKYLIDILATDHDSALQIYNLLNQIEHNEKVNLYKE